MKHPSHTKTLQDSRLSSLLGILSLAALVAMLLSIPAWA